MWIRLCTVQHCREGNKLGISAWCKSKRGQILYVDVIVVHRHDECGVSSRALAPTSQSNTTVQKNPYTRLFVIRLSQYVLALALHSSVQCTSRKTSPSSSTSSWGFRKNFSFTVNAVHRAFVRSSIRSCRSFGLDEQLC